MDLASQELDSLSHRFVSTVFVFHLLPFGHYVCLVLKIFNFSSFSTICHVVECDFNKFDATVQEDAIYRVEKRLVHSLPVMHRR